MNIKLVEKRDEAKGTKSFFWEPDTPVIYKPGQYFYYTIPTLKYPDPRGTTRHFTISSSPTEGPILRLTTRVREESGFKKTMDGLEIGAVIDGEGPNGTFMMEEADLGPHIFIAGGIGITPFRSMIKYIIDRNLKTEIYLIYSNSMPEEAAFRIEIETWAKTYPNIKVSMTMSHMEESHETWSGSTGRVDEAMLKTLIGKWKTSASSSLKIENCTWWVCGPPAFPDAMDEVLAKMNISPDKIRSEKFTGY